MRRLLIAAAAVSLMGGAALAQTGTTPSQSTAAPGPTNGAAAQGQSGSAAQDSASGAAGTSAGMSAEGGAPEGQTGSMASASEPSSGAVPSHFPKCSAQVHDNCVERSSSMRMASNSRRRQKSMPAASGDQTSANGSPGL